MKGRSVVAWVVGAALVALGGSACGGAAREGGLSGSISVDGSSTVFPFAQAAAEGFQADNPGVQVTVGQAGTGGGFEKFCAGEIDISDASRPIDEAEEVPVCEENGVDYTQVQVANDGIAAVTNPALEVDCLTTEQLAELWDEGSEVTNLSDIDSSLPDAELSLYGPGTDSGTFEFFTEQINGEEGLSRTDYQASEDDNILVEGVEGDEGGLGYFGFSYYEQNKDSLNLVEVDSGDGCVAPAMETIQSGEYAPLSRPLYMYASDQSLDSKPEVKAFMEYVVENYDTIAENALIVPMDEREVKKAQSAVTG